MSKNTVGIRMVAHGRFAVYHGRRFIGEDTFDRALTAKAAGLKLSNALKYDKQSASTYTAIRAAYWALHYSAAHNDTQLTPIVKALTDASFELVNNTIEAARDYREAVKALDKKREQLAAIRKALEVANREPMTEEEVTAFCRDEMDKAAATFETLNKAKAAESAENKRIMGLFAENKYTTAECSADMCD